MPWYHAGSHHLIHVAAVFEPETRGTLSGTLVALWTYPASPFVSGLVVLACAWVLERRGERRLAAAAVVLWAAANVLELAGKVIVSRPSVGEPGFSDSFPSGHTVRAFLTAAVVAWAWRRAAVPVVLWAVGVGCALVAIGDHVPTDVLGGALLALALVSAASAVQRRASGATP